MFFHKKNSEPITTIQILKILLGIIALAGIFVIVDILSEPSKSGGFLGFSIRRWGILSINIFALVFMFFLLYKVSTKDFEKYRNFIKKHSFSLFLGSFLTFLFSLLSALGAIHPIRHFIYFKRLQPSVFWLTFSSGIVFFTLLIRQPRFLQAFFPKETIKNKTPLKKSQFFLIIGVSLLYIVLGLFTFLEIKEALWLGDSVDYIPLAKNYAWNNPNLWMSAKPWGTAIFYKLIGTSPTIIDLAQVLFSTFAWITLAWNFSLVIRNRWLGTTSFIFILAFSLAPPVQIWNHIQFSESLSLSLMIFLFALGLSLIQKWHWTKFILIIFLFGWWIGTRDTNIYLSLLIAIMLIFIASIYKEQRIYWVLSILLLLFGYINLQISANPSFPRWLVPLSNLILQRVLPNDEYRSYFEENGMPTPPQLLALSTNNDFEEDYKFALYNSKDLDPVESWLLLSGKKVYIRFLITHPIYTITSPWKGSKELFSPDNTNSYLNAPHHSSKIWQFGALLYPKSHFFLLLLISFVLIGVALTPSTFSPSFWYTFAFLVLFLPHLYLVWHGDSAEIGRHLVQANVELHLTSWLLFFLNIDKIPSKIGYIRLYRKPKMA